MLRRRWTDNFVTGLLVLAPAYITFLIVRFVIGHIVRLFNPVFRWLDPWLASGWVTLLLQGFAIIVFVAGVTFIGWGTRILLVRRVFGMIERRAIRLPMVGKIYAALRAVTQAFSGERKSAFSRVVLVEWPGKGRYVLGFVTQEGKGEVQEKTPEHVVNVFVPTTPNPTSGFLVMVDREAMIPLEMTVEDGLKLVISGGIVGPGVPTPKTNG